MTMSELPTLTCFSHACPLYPATDSEYQIQWGTYGVIVKSAFVVIGHWSLDISGN
ncbi:hypothetical protein H6G06_06215 [Anabaena sphaerica FACHB-251]|uniref:Uncharacterized protein n=1 Tax=Anabaena sphaerica FACHB-251 TaxID=2692883 RepID=A0A927A001_9NOST|nr:hypothetical protein [Anabaena sphaerica]MBD2293089.1 hypothetical protein [Anabaena sphaerica FACHB-251]